MLRVEHFDSRDAVRWDAFVAPRASAVTDLAAWRAVLADAYGIRGHFLAATDAGRVEGTLGLFEVRHRVFGHYLTTAAFATDGGLHGGSSAVTALLAESRALATRLGVRSLVIRTRAPLEGFVTDARFCAPVVSLEHEPSDQWRALPGKTRNQVRRGQKEGFSVASGHDQLDAFHDVLHRHMRDLGTPTHGRAFYEAFVRHLGDRMTFVVVRDGERVVGGALLTWIGETAMNYHTVTLREVNSRCANYLLYWELMAMARARGCRHFDMGRSELDSTQLAFKENWSPTIAPLSYNYFVPGGGSPPRLDPRNPKFRLAIAAWKRLPIGIARRLGPHLISGIA